ncbi:MAG: hypothetical protein R3B09_01665 [Nannocystaceae bacterium]
MATVISDALERIKQVQPYMESLKKYGGSVAFAKRGKETQQNADYLQGLSGIQVASAELVKHLDALKAPFDALRNGSSATRSAVLLTQWTFTRKVLEGYAANPSDALRPATGADADPNQPMPVGLATGQQWADLVGKIKAGEWAEAREREKWTEYALAVFAFGPAGVFYVLAKESGAADKVGDALHDLDESLGISEGLQKQAESLGKIWFGVKVAAGVTAGIASLFGVGYLIRSLRSHD